MGYINGFQFADMKQQNRFFLQILSTLDGNGAQSSLFANKSWLVRATDLPNVEHNPVVVDTINSEYKIKGKSRWQDISVTFYDPIGIGDLSGVHYDGANDIHTWTVAHHDSEEDVDGYMRNYKRTMNLAYIGPDGEPTGYYWSMRGAFFANTNWGSVDVSSDDLVLIEATISYDFAVLVEGSRSADSGGASIDFAS